MKITYIYHSAFLVETDSVLLLFDYFKGDLPELNKGKPLYVFASHGHEDHFSTTIFSLVDKHPQVFFVLSNDIARSKVPQKALSQTNFLGPQADLELVIIGQETVETEDQKMMKIRTLKSTDEGVAFLVKVDGRTIYHAGDLNDWYWEGEPDSWNEQVRIDYQAEIDKLQGESIDVAFVVLDGRQEAAYCFGMDYFLDRVSVRKVFPMHFWGQYKMIQEYKEQLEDVRKREAFVAISRLGEEFRID